MIAEGAAIESQLGTGVLLALRRVCGVVRHAGDTFHGHGGAGVLANPVTLPLYTGEGGSDNG